MMQQQLPRTQPARIKITKIAARRPVKRGISLLMADQDALHVEPHASCNQQA
jgi:hypothetical protein